MKSFSFMLLLILALSCSKDKETFFDFSGIYTGEISCTGPLSSDNGETFVVTITKKEGLTYSVDLTDGVVLTAIQSENVLWIDKQIINEGKDFDVITIDGSFTKLTDTELGFEFTHDVDDEGESKCASVVEK